MKFLFFNMVVLHGIVNLQGFMKAFKLISTDEPVSDLGRSKLNGLLWVLASILYVGVAIFIFIKKDSWWLYAAIALLISQYLIFCNWEEARYGTIANLIILGVSFFGCATWLGLNM
jgi:hypothetical protein